MTTFRTPLPRLNDLLAVLAAAVLLTAVGSALVAGSLNVTLLLAGLNLALCCGVALWISLRHIRQRERVLRQVELLCNMDPLDLCDADDVYWQPTADTRNPWYAVLRQCRDYISNCGRRLREAEQHRAGAEIRARRMSVEREQVSEILSGLSDPVLAIDRFDELVFANSMAAELFGLKPQTSAGERRAIKDVIPCEPLTDLLIDTRRRKTPTVRTIELELPDARGETRWFRGTCRNTIPADAPADSAAGHGAVAVLTDISDRRIIQKRNAEFVSAVSHEMKTPLAGIKAYVELLADGDAEDEETREEFLDVINGQADRLQRLIDNLLNLARIEAGVVNVDKRHLSLNDILEEAYHVVQPAAEQKSLKLVVDLSPMYLGVMADRDMLLQTAINLLSNAIKYTSAGGTVTLRSRLSDRDVTFEVEDTGVGLSQQDCEKVFDKFYRVEKDSKMAAGTGLGLPLAKYIVDDVHGGDLDVRSVVGVGSTFRVTLASAGQLET